MAKYKIIPSSRTIVQSPISIGHKAEKGVEAIEFDVTAWVETYGSGTLTVIMRRWGDAIPYPIALEIDENNKATWTLSDTDTAKAGMAYAQLSYIVGDEVVKKSDIYTFRVMDSLTGEGDPPEAYESWLEHLTHFAAEAMAEVLDIEGIVTDKTLTVDGGIADGKATGDALALKADKSTTYTKTEVDQMIEDVEVETDTTLEVAGAAADAAETGRQIGLLKADLGAFNFFNGMLHGFIPTSGTDYPTTNASYPNAAYVIVDLKAGRSLKIAGFTTANTQGRARCIVNGEIVSTISGNTANYTTTVNLLASINNGTITALKDIQVALMFLNGIVPNDVTATIDGFVSVSEMLLDTYNSTFSLTKSVNNLSDETDDLESDLDDLSEKTFDVRDIQYLVPNIPSINYAQGYSVSAGSVSVQLDANVNYDSYWYITSKPLTLYAVPTSGQYYALAVLTGVSGTWEEHTSYKIIRGTSGARYRLSENNLPTQSSPLAVPAGALLVYTFPASNYYSAVYKNQVSNILSNSVRLNDAQLAQIPNLKKVYFKYSATSGGDSSNEHIDVYTPYKDGFIHYLIVHTESQAINSDVWRISLAYITDSSFNDVTQITTSGEWECAIHLPDRSDFSGGYAHGDEVLISDPTFFKDGKTVDITEFTDYTQCEEFSFVERTTMYDPADSTRGIAQHGSAHIFNTEKLKIQQSVLWLVDTALTNTYLAMLPIAKTVSHSFYTNARHIITAIGNTNHTESKATEAVIYGDDVSCKFSVPVYSPGSSYFFETDNGGSAYNKCYFAVAATSVTHGDVWMTETDYEFS